MSETLTIEQARRQVENMTAETRSERALELLNNPLFVATLADMESSESEALLNTSPLATDTREVHYFKVACIRQLRQDLNSTWRNIRRPTAGSAAKSADKVLQRG